MVSYSHTVCSGAASMGTTRTEIGVICAWIEMVATWNSLAAETGFQRSDKETRSVCVGFKQSLSARS